MKTLISRLLDLCYPPHCALCHRLLNEHEEHVCRFCRRRYADSCIRRELPNVRLCVAPFRYEDQVRDSLLRYKFRGVMDAGLGSGILDLFQKLLTGDIQPSGRFLGENAGLVVASPAQTLSA